MRPGIRPFTPDSPWKNCHENFEHRFHADLSWILDHSGQGLSDSELYRRATGNPQWAVGDALGKNSTLGAIGANWSFSPVAMCDGGMVQTKGLDLIFNINASHIRAEYLAKGNSHEDLKLVECGVQIARLNKYLEIESSPARCIKASGGSNGQSMAGCISTGTHGAALYAGAVHDATVGIHLVTGPDSHVWLERASRPVASDVFTNWLGATPLRDDALFNAAIVSFGSFGIIHGVMIETEPLFLLKEYRVGNFVYSDELMATFAALDISKLRQLLPEIPASEPGHELYHLEINLNPYALKKGKPGGMYVFLFYKVPVPPEHIVGHGGNYAPGPSPEFIFIMKDLLAALGKKLGYNQIKKTTTKQFEKNIRPATPLPKSIGGIFRDTRFTGNIASFAVAVETSHLPRVLDEMLAEIAGNAFAGAAAIRFVQGTQATLGFTKFPHTCVLEMDGLDSKTNHDFFANLVERFETNGIAYALHWGKLNEPLNAERVNKRYGQEKVASWKKSREMLLSPEVRAVFTNDFMKKCGLDTSL